MPCASVLATSDLHPPRSLLLHPGTQASRSAAMSTHNTGVMIMIGSPSPCCLPLPTIPVLQKGFRCLQIFLQDVSQERTIFS